MKPGKDTQGQDDHPIILIASALLVRLTQELLQSLRRRCTRHSSPPTQSFHLPDQSGFLLLLAILTPILGIHGMYY